LRAGQFRGRCPIVRDGDERNFCLFLRPVIGAEPCAAPTAFGRNESLEAHLPKISSLFRIRELESRTTLFFAVVSDIREILRHFRKEGVCWWCWALNRSPESSFGRSMQWCCGVDLKAIKHLVPRWWASADRQVLAEPRYFYLWWDPSPYEFAMESCYGKQPKFSQAFDQ
jgi:hypothetical protein